MSPVEFVTVSLHLSSEQVGQALTRSAVKELVRRVKVAHVAAQGAINITTEVVGATDLAGATKMLALFKMYRVSRLDFGKKLLGRGR